MFVLCIEAPRKDFLAMIRCVKDDSSPPQGILFILGEMGQRLSVVAI